MRNFSILLFGLMAFACQKEQPLFEALPAEQTGIAFVNNVQDSDEQNIFNYRNFYNGAGVALGDVNNDGLADVFLTANTGDNQLYLNRGNWKFEDASKQAGITGKRAWSTGVTFADVNGDGFMDIYVCNAGNRKNDDRANELFINNGTTKGGVPTFKERAKEYGLDDKGYSTHAAFFDFDRDGDLDMYLLNNSFTPIGKLGYENKRTIRDYAGGDKLFRNDGQKFTDISEAAGIFGSEIGFGLGITIGDVNNDNWLDIYISNDFYERDYLYINQKNGTFTEALEEQMNHLSLSSMGADIADINNDGNLDIFVTDMLPADDRRLKTTSTYEGYDLFQFKLTQKYHHQYMRNMLHLNNGNGTFSEVAQLAGVHATDWSWGALLFDMDNDGNKDIFVANGIAKNLTDQDFITFFADESQVSHIMDGRGFNYKDFIEKINTQPIPNYAFRNEGGLRFQNKAADWGLGEAGFSNGSAYGDLDNDGDLDLIVNNVNAPVGIFKNHSVEKQKTHFLRVKLEGTPNNRQGIGATLRVYQKGAAQTLQQMPNRGFQSSMDHTLVFGLGENATVDSLRIVWPDDASQKVLRPKTDTDLLLKYSDAKEKFVPKIITQTPVFEDITQNLDFLHEENPFVDYNRDPLLKQMLSREGPALAVGDVNKDGLDDVYLGGGAARAKKLFIQSADGSFKEADFYLSAADLSSEDVAATFFDADKDGDLDLFVVTGGNDYLRGAFEQQDKLYLNDGKGNFTKDPRLPLLADNGSCVTAADFDKDGDNDLFVGSRMVPGEYGRSPQSVLLLNDGRGIFTDVSTKFLTSPLGMVTDARWADLDKDGFPELITTEDWGPMTIWKNEKGKALSPTPIGAEGWWNRLEMNDLDNDGDLDIIAGNLGQNHHIHTSPDQPAELYTADFDQNGTVEQLITCRTENGKSYPMVVKPDLQKAIPSIKKKFIKHADFAEKTIEELFDGNIKDLVKRQVTECRSGVFWNDGDMKFSFEAFPAEAQFSPIYGINVMNKGKQVFLTGNFYDVLPEIGRYDANFGLLLTRKNNTWQTVPTGLLVRGQVRRSATLRTQKGEAYLLAKNSDKAQLLQPQK